MSVGGLSPKLDGSLGFYQDISWNGEKPCMFNGAFLAFRYLAIVKSMSRYCDSSNTL